MNYFYIVHDCSCSNCRSRSENSVAFDSKSINSSIKIVFAGSWHYWTKPTRDSVQTWSVDRTWLLDEMVKGISWGNTATVCIDTIPRDASGFCTYEYFHPKLMQ